MNNFLSVLALSVLGLSLADARDPLTSYSQDFEAMDVTDTGALGADSWLVFGNVSTADFSAYCYGYGPDPAPNLNPGVGFSNLTDDQGGPDQGARALVVYSDYNNPDQEDRSAEDPPLPNKQIEANVFQEWDITSANVGSEWEFTFDVKVGDLVAPSQATAFVKTLDPNSGFATIKFFTIDTAVLPTTWETRSIPITIEGSDVGHILQIGFNATATLYQPSAVHYDNIVFAPTFEPEVPRIEIISYTKTGTTVRIDFESAAGVEYDLEKYVGEVFGWELVESITATGATEFLEDINAVEPIALYRVIEFLGT